MCTEHEAFDRRHLLRRLGSAAAIAAFAPAALSTQRAEAHSRVCDELVAGSPESVGMCSDRIEDVLARVERRVNEKLVPGAVALIARHGKIVAHRPFGNKLHGEEYEPVTRDTIFDLLSMTKVVATATSALILVQDGVLRLNDRVADFVPEFAQGGKKAITVHQMLSYTAGLPVDIGFLDELLEHRDAERAFEQMAAVAPSHRAGGAVLYSDLTYRLLGRVIEAASGMDLDTFAKARIWGPLGMRDTMFKPPARLIPRIAATGYSDLRGRLVRGEVQDEQDFALGGIVGCDGVFSTAKDLAIFCQMLLNGGTYGRVRILSRQVAAAMVSNQTPQVRADKTDTSPLANLLETPKGYGWELATRRFSSGGMRLSRGSYGKAGGAGTFMWIDPHRDLFGILLTNHGLPPDIERGGWSRMLDAIGCAEFFDGIINAVTDE